MTQFKVGDWIRSTKYTHMKPCKIESIYASNDRKGDFGFKSGGTVHYASESELWQPKEGEWCWFSSFTGTRSFGQFIRMKGDGHYRFRASNGEEYNARNCEPFIGKLPSFLKDYE